MAVSLFELELNLLSDQSLECCKLKHFGYVKKTVELCNFEFTFLGSKVFR